ncbi:MAG: hypothetical protein OEL66_04780 [Desulfobulbaceae bacterium]|nr:hypothetical protein [Desulfobulbaceae bacterium]
MRRCWVYLAVFLIFTAGQGCTRHTIDSRHDVTLQPVEVKPIHITIDVNIKVDRALDDFFGDLDESSAVKK